MDDQKKTNDANREILDSLLDCVFLRGAMARSETRILANLLMA